MKKFSLRLPWKTYAKPARTKSYTSGKIMNKTELAYTRYIDVGDTVEVMAGNEVVANEPVRKAGKFDAVVIFEVEEGEFDENVVNGLGGAVVDTDGRGFKDF